MKPKKNTKTPKYESLEEIQYKTVHRLLCLVKYKVSHCLFFKIISHLNFEAKSYLHGKTKSVLETKVHKIEKRRKLKKNPTCSDSKVRK